MPSGPGSHQTPSRVAGAGRVTRLWDGRVIAGCRRGVRGTLPDHPPPQPEPFASPGTSRPRSAVTLLFTASLIPAGKPELFRENYRGFPNYDRAKMGMRQNWYNGARSGLRFLSPRGRGKCDRFSNLEQEKSRKALRLGGPPVVLPRRYPGQVLGRPASLDPLPLPVDLDKRAPRDLEESPCPVPGPDPELEHVRGVAGDEPEPCEIFFVILRKIRDRCKDIRRERNAHEDVRDLRDDRKIVDPLGSAHRLLDEPAGFCDRDCILQRPVRARAAATQDRCLLVFAEWFMVCVPPVFCVLIAMSDQDGWALFNTFYVELKVKRGMGLDDTGMIARSIRENPNRSGNLSIRWSRRRYRRRW